MTEKSKPVPKTLLSAASALTTLAESPPPRSSTSFSSCSEETSSDDQNTNSDMPITFPQTLMEILSNEVYSDVISWLPHGLGFVILDKKKFAAEVMPRYFRQTKYTSFTRKLNRWGFTRVSKGPDAGAYYHKYFQRNNKRLCVKMTCQSRQSGPLRSDSMSTGSQVSQTPSLLNIRPATKPMTTFAEAHEIQKELCRLQYLRQIKDLYAYQQYLMLRTANQNQQGINHVANISYSDYSAAVIDAAVRTLHRSDAIACMDKTRSQPQAVNFQKKLESLTKKDLPSIGIDRSMPMHKPQEFLTKKDLPSIGIDRSMPMHKPQESLTKKDLPSIGIDQSMPMHKPQLIRRPRKAVAA